MAYQQYLQELVGKTVWIQDNDEQPWVTVSIDEDDGDRGEIVEVGADYCVLRYKRRLRRDIQRALPLQMVTVIRDA